MAFAGRKGSLHQTGVEAGVSGRGSGAYAIGFLAGQEMRLRENTCPGSADRPSWMDIRLDDPAALATHHFRLRPIALRSLLDAGYQCLGDLRWVPSQRREVRKLALNRSLGRLDKPEPRKHSILKACSQWEPSICAFRRSRTAFRDAPEQDNRLAQALMLVLLQRRFSSFFATGYGNL